MSRSVEVERREKAIAHELEDLALVVQDRPRHRLEVRVEDLQQLLVRHAIRDIRIAAQDRKARSPRGCCFTERRSISPVSTWLAGIGADVGLEQRARDIERRARFHGQGKVGQRLAHLLQVSLVEAARNVRRAGKEDALQRIESRVADEGGSPFSEAVSAPPKGTMRAA